MNLAFRGGRGGRGRGGPGRGGPPGRGVLVSYMYMYIYTVPVHVLAQWPLRVHVVMTTGINFVWNSHQSI